MHTDVAPNGRTWSMAIAAVGAAMLFSAIAAPGAQAQTQIRIGWPTGESEIDPYAETARQFQQALNELAPGDFELMYFPSRQLGDEREMLENISLGVQDAGVITGTAIATMESAFQLNDLPFLYESSKQAQEVLDGRVGDALLEKLADNDVVGLGFAEAGFRHTINNVRPITKPEDFDGVRLRVQPSDLFVDAFTALGASPTAMAWGETFTAVQQGAVDGLEIPLNVILGNNYNEVTKYLSLTAHSYNAPVLAVSQRLMDSLSEEQQTTVREAGRLAVQRQREANAKNEAAALQSLNERGFVSNDIESHAAFREKMAPVYESYRDAVGPDLMDQAMQALGN
jgi:TRAP-type transport system periplasmic protein